MRVLSGVMAMVCALAVASHADAAPRPNAMTCTTPDIPRPLLAGYDRATSKSFLYKGPDDEGVATNAVFDDRGFRAIGTSGNGTGILVVFSEADMRMTITRLTLTPEQQDAFRADMSVEGKQRLLETYGPSILGDPITLTCVRTAS